MAVTGGDRTPTDRPPAHPRSCPFDGTGARDRRPSRVNMSRRRVVPRCRPCRVFLLHDGAVAAAVLCLVSAFYFPIMTLRYRRIRPQFSSILVVVVVVCPKKTFFSTIANLVSLCFSPRKMCAIRRQSGCTSSCCTRQKRPRWFCSSRTYIAPDDESGGGFRVRCVRAKQKKTFAKIDLDCRRVFVGAVVDTTAC